MIMKKKLLIFLFSLTILISGFSVSNISDFNTAYANEDNLIVDYSLDKWDDTSSNFLWEIDKNNQTFTFNTNSTDEDKLFTRNVLLTDQFKNVRGAQVSLQATFTATTTSKDLIDAEKEADKELHFGLIPWYKDSNNWVICYIKFASSSEESSKDGHIFEVQVYVKIDGSTHVSYYCRSEENKWIDKNDENNNEWHSTWPDRDNINKNPSTLEKCELEPTDEITFYARKTRKTYAGKECDSIYVKVNDYELNFGLDNFMFTGLKEKEDEDSSFIPKVGFYLYNTKKATVSNFSINVSHDEILPIPVVEPLSTLTTSGTINKKINVPEFEAYNNNGELISYDIVLFDPNNELIYLDGEDYFIPLKAGNYQVKVSATDNEYIGTYIYVIKVKGGSSHIDNDVYDDIFTYVPYDSSIPIAYAIFISVPLIILLYIGIKIYFYYKKKGKIK